MGSSSPIVVGIMYPSWWYGSEDGFAEEVAALEAIDPRIEVVFPTYEEPHEVRTARGAPQADGAAPIVRGEAANTATTYGYDSVTMMQETKTSVCQIERAA